ncbi:protein ApaG [Agaribacter marinus]|uniref:Protein ApaG n=2 Tax=Agaribacter marinus TaxID=1431249 RepID=A0AA37T5P6_9ALTE|nr:protein ApaG [Agaribacter marinus]
MPSQIKYVKTKMERISVAVKSKFIGKQDQGNKEQVFVFSYTVSITNNSEQDMTLKSRYWLITNGDGEKVEVQGEGVVGEQPTIKPKDTFSYSSASMLKTKVGTMEGFYDFSLPDNSEYRATIPVFSLAVPNSLH